MQKPILFSTPMVQAILDGRKTQTRRIVKKQPVYDQDSGYKYWDDLMFDIHDEVLETMYMPDHCPYGEKGSVLWVRETFYGSKYPYIYKADDNTELFKSCQPDKWKPSIFMPKEACRIKLEITNIRAERLQDITEEDSKAEGIKQEFDTWLDYGCKEEFGNFYLMPKESFMSLWEKINGEKSWNSNPWVWVIEFKKL